MSKKQILRNFTNIVMILLFISLFLNKITGNKIHESFGVLFLSFIILHVSINSGWFTSFFRAKQTTFRVLNTLIIFLMLLSMSTLIFSSIMISKFVFTFLGFKSTLMLQQIHTTSAYWFLFFSSIHIGLQWQRLVAFAKKRFPINVKLNYIFILFVSALIVIYAGYVVMQRDIISKLFMRFAFEFWNYEQAKWHVVLDYVSIVLSIIIITRVVFKLTCKKKYKNI
ncbi:MAG: DUF4405 domain-containing protein [Campylobacteraceae bacterium]